ncbi:GNAT family N-acetyltransferase [Mucilaginibacter psychrotolerans]|uniref:GNAT family N-acetyltransferase n=1 Tax=Mucilaginibacter psychrotolerans TaxID=1524096 RepID=A0A4Y8S9N7_9SPHI|nr:GNAT family N-acetyltransferase [Mucilaginibacter psychrotolerans]TFF35086.1 GNAT family N-acetyltransferase [Mucilaginibacter psychrotolerans]
MTLSIEQITPQLTWRLRRDVLYPDQHLRDMEMDEDNHGYHFGTFAENKLVAVVSLFQREDGWQFRKFAVIAELQGKGVGGQLLDYITEFARQENGRRLWCNARFPAIGFYNKFGFTAIGELFHKNGIDYIVMQKDLPQN